MDYCMQLLKELAVVTKTEMGPVMLRIYMGELEKIGWLKASKALETCFLDLRRFPTCLEILEKAGVKEPQKEDEANKIASDIIAATSRIGEYRAVEAEAKLGNLAWEVVKRIGGWTYLCNLKEDQLGNLRAQLRDLVKAVSAFDSVGRLSEKPTLQSSIADEALKLMEAGVKDAKILADDSKRIAHSAAVAGTSSLLRGVSLEGIDNGFDSHDRRQDL